ncbi:MAG: hypothetical protein HZC28_16770 [Spirochaetes bacterium]|nr:hypothetical protein [Spirochaetota bacterium]
MKNKIHLSILVSFLCIAFSLTAQITVVAGTPATEPVSEPFSVDFDTSGIMHGVEFTKANRVFKVVNGIVMFIAGVEHGTNLKVTDAADGPAISALFYGMHDIAITGNKAYIADTFNNRIRLLDLAAGTVSTVAGSGISGFTGDNDTGMNVRFAQPICGVLSPDKKTLYVADIGNGRTRTIDLATGIVQTIAGNGKKGPVVDGTAALDCPLRGTRAVTVTADGTVYIVLREGNSLVTLRNGVISNVVNASGKAGYAGDGGNGRDALMRGPKYLATDKENRVLINDTENHCIRRYDPASGVIELIAGIPGKVSSNVGTTWLETGLKRPHGVRIGPDGMLYVADTENNRVLRGPYK